MQNAPKQRGLVFSLHNIRCGLMDVLQTGFQIFNGATPMVRYISVNVELLTVSTIPNSSSRAIRTVRLLWK